MKQATRSRSGAALVGDKGVSKGGSKVDDDGAGRIRLAHGVDAKTAAVRFGQPRDIDGRFIKGGSKMMVSVAGHAKNQVAAPVLVVGGGSKAGSADSGRSLQVQASADLGGDGDLAQRVSSEGNEVSEYVSSSANSGSDDDFDDEEEVELEETGNPNSDLLGLSSSQSGKIGDSVAQQVFAEMPHPVQNAAGGRLGIDASARVPERGEGGVPKTPWVNLFKDNRNLGMGLKLDEWDVDGDLVMLEDDDVDIVEETWGYCLVGLFAGKFPGWTAVRKLREGWKVNCTHWRHRSGWFVFKFQSDDDRRKVLEGGPYFAYGSNLILKNMPRCFRFEGDDVSSVPTWIKLPGLPLDCWNARALGKIASKVGKPISTDKLTLSKERISFARVLVEVDASKDIISEVEVRLPTGEVYQQSVIPELIPKFCKMCKSFGHVEGGCGKGSVGMNGKFVDDKRARTGGGAVNCSGVNLEGSGPLDDSLIQMATASGPGDCGDAAGSDQLGDLASDRIQAWLLSGPKLIRDAAAVPRKERIDAVFSALPLALGVPGVFTRATNVPEVGGDGGGENLEAIDEDSSVDLESDDGGNTDVGVTDLGATPVMDQPYAGGRCSGEGRPILQVEPVPATTIPVGGLEADTMGWNTVVKKGRRRRR